MEWAQNSVYVVEYNNNLKKVTNEKANFATNDTLKVLIY